MGEKKRARCGRLAGWVGIICNILLSAGKFIAGNLSGSVSNLTLYAYGMDGRLAQVPAKLWSLTDENGTAVTELTDGTLYELRVTVADGGALDLSEMEKEIRLSVVLGK